MRRLQGHLRGRTRSAAAVAVAASLLAAPAASQTGVDRAVEHDGRTRTYRLFTPSSLDPGTPAPLVFALHGGGGNGAREEGRVRYNEFAERDGWIVVYPDAVDGHWNDLRGFEGFVSHREHVDDIGFIALLLAQLSTEFSIDQNRVFLTSGSNGGLMAHAAAEELADRIVGIAPIVGSMTRPVYEAFRPSREVSVLMINDRGDPAVLWEGGAGGRANFVSVPATAAKWREVNGCTAETSVVADALRDIADDTRVTHTVWGGCSPGTRMELYVVEANRHGHPTAVLDKENGRRVYEVIWDFFAHSRR